MVLITKDYLNLSALAYIDFSKSLMGATIKELIERKAIPKKTLTAPDSPPYRTLQILFAPGKL